MNAVIYARYSSHGQTEQSIEGQLHDCYDFALREGYTIIGEYIDRAMTGRNDNRDDFQRMIADSAKQQFQYVIVWKLDRFARNRYDSAIYKAKLKKHGVRVISAKENLSDSPEGIILEGMLESMAEYYSANLSVNVKRGQRETLAKGKYCGGHIPYGYRSVDGKLVHDERTAPIVKYVFQQYAQGMPKKKIIDALTARGIKSPTGKPLTITSYQSMLKNPIYIGRLVRNGVVVEGCAEPLIDQETFDKVQMLLHAHGRAPAAAKAPVEYTLYGKAFCGHCGSRMIGDSGRGKGGTVYHYYSCASRKKNRSCDKRNEKKDFAEAFVVDHTLKYVLAPTNRNRIASAVVAEYKKDFSSQRIDELQRILSRLEADLEKLVDALLDAPKVAHKKIYAKMENLELQKAELETDIAKLKIAQGIQFTEDEVIAWLKSFCCGDPTDPAFCRRIIDVFVNAVYFYDDYAVVFYNIKGGKPVTHNELKTVLESTTVSSKCSDLYAHALPSPYLSEPMFIFVNGVFGYVFKRSE